MSVAKVELIISAKDKASGVLKGIGGAVKKMGKLMVVSLAAVGLSLAGVAAGLTKFVADSVKGFNEYQQAMTTLGIMAERFGVSASKAKTQAEKLGKELRLGVGPAASSLQNLLQSGLNLDQATDLMGRFTNEAITGKVSSMKLGDAVQNLAFAYKTEMSALMDRSGISENFSTLLEKEAKLRGVEIEQLDEAARNQLKYQAFIRLTNLTMGASDKFLGTYVDNLAILNQELQDGKVQVGKFVTEGLNVLLIKMRKSGVIQKFLTGMKRLAAVFQLFVTGNFTKAIKEALGGIEDSPIVTRIMKIRNAIIGLFNLIVKGKFTQELQDAFGGFEKSTLVVKILELRGIVLETFGSIKESLGEFGDDIGPKVSEAFLRIANSIKIFIINLPENIENAKIKFEEFKVKLQEIWNSPFVQGAVTFIQLLKDTFVSFTQGALVGFMSGWNELVAVYNDKLKPAIDSLVALIKDILTEAFGDATGESNTFIERAKVVGTIMGRMLVDNITKAIDIISAIIRIITKLIEKGRRLSNSVRSFAKTWSDNWNKASNRVRIAKNQIISYVNQIISMINKIPGVNVPELGGGALSSKQFGGLAGGLTTVGEAGPEIVQLPPGSNVFSNQQSQMMGGQGGGGGLTININGNMTVDSESRIDELVRKIEIALGSRTNLEFRGV